MYQRRVVITGIGAISPNGIGWERFWQACVQGRSGIRQLEQSDIRSLPTYIAGNVPAFPALDLGVTEDEVRLLDRATQFALAASDLALRDGGVLTETNTFSPLFQRDTCGVCLGTGIASIPVIDRLYLEQVAIKDARFSNTEASSTGSTDAWEIGMGERNCVLEQHKGHVDESHAYTTHLATMLMASNPAAAIASHHQLHGPCMVYTTACSSGIDAIGQAFWNIQEGRANAMLAGGCDAPINAIVVNALCIIGGRSLSGSNSVLVVQKDTG